MGAKASFDPICSACPVDKGTELEQQNTGSSGFPVSVDVKCGILIKANYTHRVWNKLKASSGHASFCNYGL